MAMRMKSSKGRRVSAKSATRKKVAVSKPGRRPKAATVQLKRKLAPGKRKPAPAKPRSKPAPAIPRRKPAPVAVKPRRKPAAAKGPSVATRERRIQQLERQVQAGEHDRAELARWRAYHSQLQEQVKAKDSALAFKEKELLDLRRQLEDLKAQVKKKETSG